jgi:hypothetical protein
MTQNNDTQIPQQFPKPGSEHRLLDVFIGRWINEGYTTASADAPSVKILTSDVYEWAPGGFFVLHTAYGRIGNFDVGAIEIISYDAATKKYRSDLFDAQGQISTHELTVQDGVWTWVGGTWAGEQHRATAVFSDQGKTQTAHHERLDEQGNWVPSMEVTLTRVE